MGGENIRRIVQEGTYMAPPDEVAEGIVTAILDAGASEALTLEIYQSKHVRWFHSMRRSRAQWPKTAEAAYKEFAAYIRNNSNEILNVIRRGGF